MDQRPAAAQLISDLARILEAYHRLGYLTDATDFVGGHPTALRQNVKRRGWPPPPDGGVRVLESTTRLHFPRYKREHPSQRPRGPKLL
jgi:hypothetical protein